MRREKLEELKELIDKVKVVKMKKVDTDKKFITSTPYDVTLKNGMVIRREKLLKGGNVGSAAVILPLTTEGEVLLAVEPRVFTNRGVGVGLPAGYIEYKENEVKGALRELKEETGYSCNKYIDLGGFYQDMGCSGAYNRLFLGIDCEKVCEPSFDPGEVVLPYLCTYEEALELIDLGYIEDANTIITLMRAKSEINRLRMLKY